jgi:glycosyltransferase involved in cell wall biosynthesis
VRCAVVPLRSGGGSPLKFIEALAYGVPVVATPRAAAGLRVSPGEHYVQAEAAEDVARAVIAQLEDPDRALAARGRALVDGEYSIDRLCQLLHGDA